MSSAIPLAVPIPNQAFAQVIVCGPGIPGPNGVMNIPCPPQTRITSAADANGNAVQNGGSTVSTSITFQVTATPGTYPGNPIASFQCSLDGISFSSCSTTNPATISYNNLAVGQHTFEIRAVDTQGITDPNPATFSWTITMQPPNHTTITSVVDGNGAALQSGGSTVSTSITFQVTATPGTNPIAGFQCSLDNSQFTSCATTSLGTISYNNLAAGQHKFAVRAVDTQGNTDPTPATFSWTVLTPTQGIQQLINTIESFNLPKGVTTSLEAPLNAALAQLNRNHATPACNQLNAFLNQVNAKQNNGQLTSQQAAELTQQAKAIQQAIGCSNISGMLGQTNQLLNNVGLGDNGGDDNNDDDNP